MKQTSLTKKGTENLTENQVSHSFKLTFSLMFCAVVKFTKLKLKMCLSVPHTGLPQTKLGSYLETRVNDFLKRQSHPESGEVTIRVVHVSDKVVEVKPGMKSRYRMMHIV